MISVDDALKTVTKGIKVLDPETVELTDALERVLAQDLSSDTDIPLWDNSAMDGYAVRFQDTRGASRDNPKILKVITDIKAGDLPKKKLKAGEAIRIMTGAIIPSGANSVVMVEETASVNSRQSTVNRKNCGQWTMDCGLVRIFKAVAAGENIRRKGEDIKRGELVIKKGTLLKPSHIGLLASLGKARVKVTRRPKVAILATGDEVVDVKEKLKAGKIRSSNTYTLYTQIIKSGGTVKNLGIAKDKPQELEKKIKQGLDCDLILTSGGVSVGDYDLVKDILAKLGTNIKFWKVAMRPGKPLVFGKIRGIPLFGLPGNPVSSMVSFEVFVRPVILKMLGQEAEDRKEVEAVLAEDITKKKGLKYFLRAQTQWDGSTYLTRTTGPQGSGILKSMALANSLIILAEEMQELKKGERVTVKFLD